MRETVKAVKADQKYWQELEKHIPWQLWGFTGREQATFITNPCHPRTLPHPPHPSYYLQITGSQRDQLITAFEKTPGTALQTEK